MAPPHRLDDALLDTALQQLAAVRTRRERALRDATVAWQGHSWPIDAWREEAIGAHLRMTLDGRHLHREPPAEDLDAGVRWALHRLVVILLGDLVDGGRSIAAGIGLPLDNDRWNQGPEADAVWDEAIPVLPEELPVTLQGPEQTLAWLERTVDRLIVRMVVAGRGPFLAAIGHRFDADEAEAAAAVDDALRRLA